MKRKEFIEKLAGRCGRSADYPTRFDAMAATLAEEAGAQWDPEEPELPERLTLVIHGSGVVIWPGGRELVYPTWLDLSLVDEKEPLRKHEVDRLKELLARYNFVSVLLEYYDLHKGMETSEGRLLRNFAGLLRQERDKLR